jgi:predicted Zn-dependent protease
MFPAGPQDSVPRPYWPDRRDYGAFEAAHRDLIEPNYLPFMAHRLPGDDPAGDYLVLCRWSEASMPLKVYLESPVIPAELEDEFDPIEPARFVAAVESALAHWEEELEGLVAFERTGDRAAADLELVLVAEEAPEESDRRGLGRISLSHACQSDGEDPDSERLQVHYRVARLLIYLADPHGLLDPHQVESIALHELGHALGMRSHSPIPSDAMYEVVRDLAVPRLSAQDVNSFLSLYRLENGTIFGHVPLEPSAQPAGPEPPTGQPTLAMAPYVDVRLGFEVRPPEGWMRMETGQGMVAIDGVTWDYTASFQVIVHRYPTIEAYLERFGAYHLSRGAILRRRFSQVSGRRAFRAVVLNFDGRSADQITLIEVGDGRVVAVIADCPAEVLDAYEGWFEAALTSLEIWPEPK